MSSLLQTAAFTHVHRPKQHTVVYAKKKWHGSTSKETTFHNTTITNTSNSNNSVDGSCVMQTFLQNNCLFCFLPALLVGSSDVRPCKEEEEEEDKDEDEDEEEEEMRCVRLHSVFRAEPLQITQMQVCLSVTPWLCRVFFACQRYNERSASTHGHLILSS